MLRSCCLMIILPFVSLNSLRAQTAKEIVEKADEKLRGSSSVFQLLITTKRPDWSRTMEVKGWTKGNDYTLLQILSPARDKGIVFLKRRKEVWSWYPTLERVIKLPPSMMNQSWMGTDFTNDDLVKEASVVHDYTHTFGSDTFILNRNCYSIILTPKVEAAVIWGGVRLCIDKKDFIELHARFYDESGKLIQTMIADEVKQMDDRTIATRFEMIPAGKKGHKTELKYVSVKFNMPISDSFFTTESIKKLQ